MAVTAILFELGVSLDEFSRHDEPFKYGLGVGVENEKRQGNGESDKQQHATDHGVSGLD